MHSAIVIVFLFFIFPFHHSKLYLQLLNQLKHTIEYINPNYWFALPLHEDLGKNKINYR